MPKLGGTAFGVYCALVSFARPMRPHVYPSLETLSEMTGFSKNSIITAVKTLVTHGLLEYKRGSSKHATNVYTLLPTPTLEDSQKLGIDQPTNPKICDSRVPKFAPEVYEGEVYEETIVSSVKPEKPKKVKKPPAETDQRIRPFFEDWKTRSTLAAIFPDPTPYGQIAAQVHRLPTEFTSSVLRSAINEFFLRPDPWVKNNLGLTFKGFFHQLPRIAQKQQTPRQEKRIMLADVNGE